MHKLDDEKVFSSVVASLKEQLGVQHIRKIAIGNEFYIFKADYASGPVIIKSFLIPARLTRRWQELHRLVDNLPTLPRVEILNTELQAIGDAHQLLHMDFRQANFRMQNGKVIALLDWSNTLISHPALKLARVSETGETGQEFLKGYASIKKLPKVSPVAETIFHLDTATMLTLVFLSENSDPKRASAAVTRVEELHAKLMEELELRHNNT